MTLQVLPIDVLSDTSATYDSTKTSLIGRLTLKNLSGVDVVGPPLVKYRNTIAGSESISPTEVVISQNDRLFAATSESSGILTIALYDLENVNGEVDYVGKINIQLPEPPATSYAIRGFRVVDSGLSNWKIFLLVTANQVQHNGLYMVDNVAITDFNFVAPFIPTATAPAQKAVYKLDNPSFDLNNGTGLSIDLQNSKAYVHRGVSNAHSFIRYDYSLPINSVGAIGSTVDLYEFETGQLPALSGTLLLTNSEEFTVPTSGPNTGEPCVIFHTNTFMYRGRLSELLSGSTSWPSLEFVNNQGNTNSFTATITIRAAFSESSQKVIILSSSSSTPATVIIKDFAENQHDIVCTVLSPDNNENITRDMYKFKAPIAFVGFDSKNGYLAGISSTTGARGIYTAAFDVDDIFDSTHIISPVIDIRNKVVSRFTAGFVKPEFASPLKIYYRTSGFNNASGGWIPVLDDLNFGNVSSPTGLIQIKIGYKVFINDSTNGLQIYGAGLVVFDKNSISDNWEYSHEFSSPSNPSRTAFRLKKEYQSLVPTLFYRARDLSDNIFVQANTVDNPASFEFSTDNGLSWQQLGVIPNTEGTLIRYNFATPIGIDVRPSLGEI